MSKNLHLLYYKDYFSGIDWTSEADQKDKIKQRNPNLTRSGLLTNIPNEAAKVKFQVEVLYPGLVTGIGINHEASIEGEFKLGMHFDWTYGMPVIYGSSVKGVLRSWFKEIYNPYSTEKDKDEVKKMMVDDIFEGKGKSIYNRDIFFDAVIVKADKRGRILCSDSITPHGGKDHDNPLINPTPITFLKIAPGCKIEFRFKLVDTTIITKDGKEFTLMAKEKLDLFKEILTTVGVGAKTNVGYGQLKSVQI